MRLSSDTKAVLRELRRHDRALEMQLERVASAIVDISFSWLETTESAKNELVLRRRSA